MIDAIDKAEGLKENADIKDINLAFRLEDGMKIYIPTSEETSKTNTQEDIDYITSSSGLNQEDTQSETNYNERKLEKININTASQTQLETLPGIGPSIALKIINYREDNGNFKVIEEIKEVSGIGEAKFENIKDLICVK